MMRQIDEMSDGERAVIWRWYHVLRQTQEVEQRVVSVIGVVRRLLENMDEENVVQTCQFDSERNQLTMTMTDETIVGPIDMGVLVPWWKRLWLLLIGRAVL